MNDYIADERVRQIPGNEHGGYVLTTMSPFEEENQKKYILRRLYKKLAAYYLNVKYEECLDIIAECIEMRGDLSAQIVHRSPRETSPLGLGKDTLAIVFQRHYNDTGLFQDGAFVSSLTIGNSQS